MCISGSGLGKFQDFGNLSNLVCLQHKTRDTRCQERVRKVSRCEIVAGLLMSGEHLDGTVSGVSGSWARAWAGPAL